MLSSRFRQTLANSSRARYEQLNQLTGGSLGIFVRAARSFNDRNSFDAAAAIAFYALFSLFPLLLLLIVIGSFWLESEAVQLQLLRLMAYALPGSLDYLAKIIDEVLALQRTASLISVIGLLWSATGVFYALAYNVSSAWQSHRVRGFFAGRFIALIIVGLLAGLLFLSVISTAVVDLLAQANISIEGLHQTYTISPARIFSRFLPIAIRLLVFLGLYRWIPNTKVDWIEALWGAFVAALGWELTTIGFTWYLGSRWGQFEVIYGSLGTIIGLMLWVYIGTLITLFGAHLSAAVGHHRQAKARAVAKQQERVPKTRAR